MVWPDARRGRARRCPSWPRRVWENRGSCTNLRKAVAGEDVAFLEGRCLSYGRGTAYHPIVEILKSIFELNPGEEEGIEREKVARGLRRLKIPEGANLSLILKILGAEESGNEKPSLSPDARKDLIQTLLKQILLAVGEGRPLILTFEDLHWIDQSSEEVLKTHSRSGSRRGDIPDLHLPA